MIVDIFFDVIFDGLRHSPSPIRGLAAMNNYALGDKSDPVRDAMWVENKMNEGVRAARYGMCDNVY